MHTIRRMPIDNSSPPAYHYDVVYQTGVAKDAYTLVRCDTLLIAVIITQTLNGGTNTQLHTGMPGFLEVFT